MSPKSFKQRDHCGTLRNLRGTLKANLKGNLKEPCGTHPQLATRNPQLATSSAEPEGAGHSHQFFKESKDPKASLFGEKLTEMAGKIGISGGQVLGITAIAGTFFAYHKAMENAAKKMQDFAMKSVEAGGYKTQSATEEARARVTQGAAQEAESTGAGWGALSGAATGGAIGAKVFGIPGLIAGGIIGGVVGGVSGGALADVEASESAGQPS